MEISNTCNHSDKERAIEGTWVSLEVQDAIKSGYKILKLYEIRHYPDKSEYNKLQKSGGLFGDYVYMFLKYKQEASGYPDNVIRKNQKNEYIQNYFEKKGNKWTRKI